MDPVRFDSLARTLATTGTRRRLLRLLAAVPVAGGVLSLFDAESIAGNGHQGNQGRKGGKGGRGGKGGNAKGHKGGKGKHRSRTSSGGLRLPTPPSNACGPFVQPCPGDPQCGSFGKPCPSATQCVDGTCSGDSCPSASFSCLGTSGGECCAGRDDCCWCLNTATNESYGYCTSAGSPCSSGAEFGSGVTCARV
jgi:hypothetical protein